MPRKSDSGKLSTDLSSALPYQINLVPQTTKIFDFLGSFLQPKIIPFAEPKDEVSRRERECVCINGKRAERVVQPTSFHGSLCPRTDKKKEEVYKNHSSPVCLGNGIIVTSFLPNLCYNPIVQI